MDFDWMHYELPDDIVARNAERLEQMHRDEVRVRAGLLRRLGHDRDYAAHRCLGNQLWAYEVACSPPIEPEDIRGEVDWTYKR